MSDVPLKPLTITECKQVTKMVIDEEAFDMEPSISSEELERLGQTDLGSVVIESALDFGVYTPPGFVTTGIIPADPVPPGEVPVPAALPLFLAGILLLIHVWTNKKGKVAIRG